MSALEAIALVAGILLFVGVALVVVWVPIARRAKRVRAGIEDELGDGLRRIANARGLGLQSLGRGQIRGNGWLVLTDDELRFRQWVPARETRIPLADVTSVGTERWWLGKTVGSRLLRVRWRTAAGEDAMAWQVADLDAWLAALGAPRDG